MNPDNFKTKPRLPRWEAEPDYGLPRPARAGAPVDTFPGNEGRRKLGEGLSGLPIVKPPYGVMAAIDLKNGSLMFQVPHGDTPDAIRDNPLLKGMNLGKTGQNGSVGVLITKTLVDRRRPAVHGAARARPRRDAARLQQADRRAGRRSAAAGADRRHPMTYSLNGKQYIVVGVSGGNYRGEYISLALPASAATTTQQPRQ